MTEPTDKPTEDVEGARRILPDLHRHKPYMWRPGLCGPRCPACRMFDIIERLAEQRDAAVLEKAIQRGLVRDLTAALETGNTENARLRKRLTRHHADVGSTSCETCEPGSVSGVAQQETRAALKEPK